MMYKKGDLIRLGGSVFHLKSDLAVVLEVQDTLLTDGNQQVRVYVQGKGEPEDKLWWFHFHEVEHYDSI